MRNPLSQTITTIPPSGIRKFFDIVSEMKDAISLGVGEPDFDTPWHIREEGIFSLEKGQTFYTSNAGLKELKIEICNYLERRFQVSYNYVDECMVTVGGSEAIDIALRAMLDPGDEVLIPQPSYVSYPPCTILAGGVPVPIPLKEENQFKLTRQELLDAITEKTKVLIMPFPNNPTGAIMEREDLEAIAEVIIKHDLYVISDEIWSDLYLADNHHIPTQSVSEDAKMRTIAFYAPSKTFNLAGLIGSYHIIYNPWLRDRIRKESSLSHYNSMNVLSMYALIGAYEPEGWEWLEELKEVLTQNVDYAVNFIENNWKGVSVSKPQATYMLFIDCEEWCKVHGETMDDVEKAGLEVGVLWQDGRAFHGEYCIRMNLALPFARVQEAFERLDEYVFNVQD